jgi:hypothetical protein
MITNSPLPPSPTDIAMSTSVGDEASYPGRSFSVSQLLDAAKRKLRDPTFGGRCVGTACLSSLGTKTRILQNRNDHEPG